MKLMLQIKNDLNYLRHWLIVWGCLLFIPVVMVALLRTNLGWDMAYWALFRTTMIIGFLGQVVFQLILVAMLIQKESPINRQAYWRTRPMSRGGVPMAKVLLFLGVIMLPQMIQMGIIGGLWAEEWNDVAGPMFQMGVLSLVFLIFSLPAASQTRTAGQAMLGLIAGAVGLSLLLSWVTSIFPGYRLADFLPWVLFGLTLLLVGVVYVRIYCQEKPIMWGGRGYGCALMPLLLTVNNSPDVWHLSRGPRVELPEEAELTVASLRYEVRRERPAGGTTGSSDANRKIWSETASVKSYGLQAVLDWSGLPENRLAVTVAIRTETPNGRALFDGGKRPSRSLFLTAQMESYLQQLFPDLDREDKIHYGQHWVQMFSSSDLEPETMDWPARFTSEIETTFYTPEKVRLALEPGSRLEFGGNRLLVKGIEASEDEVRLRLDFLSLGAWKTQPFAFDGGLFILRDPKKREVSVGILGSRSQFNVLNIMAMGSSEVEFEQMRVRQEDLSRLELYYVGFDLVGRDVRSVDYEVE